jgi:hypothetical protein
MRRKTDAGITSSLTPVYLQPFKEACGGDYKIDQEQKRRENQPLSGVQPNQNSIDNDPVQPVLKPGTRREPRGKEAQHHGRRIQMGPSRLRLRSQEMCDGRSQQQRRCDACDVAAPRQQRDSRRGIVRPAQETKDGDTDVPDLQHRLHRQSRARKQPDVKEGTDAARDPAQAVARHRQHHVDEAQEHGNCF